MRGIRSFELPPELQESLEKAKKLEWATIGYQLSVVVVMFLVMGSSEAMKSAWLEDTLGMVPSVVFLIATKINNKKPDDKFRYGYHRVFSIAFLIGATALLVMGLFLVIDSSITLLKGEHPTIGTVFLGDTQVWLGWVMIAALLYSSLPAMYLGFKKLPLAKKLHNKVLFTDAKAQKADYMTAFAAIAGIIGLGAGWWWADAVAAIFISVSVLKDGLTYVTTAIQDLMDRYPVTLEKEEKDPIIEELKEKILTWDWVKAVNVRFREDGQAYLGEVAFIPNGEINLEKMEWAYQEILGFHWKINDVAIAPVKTLPEW